MKISDSLLTTVVKQPKSNQDSQFKSFAINDLLTANDKNLVEAATTGLQPTSSSGLHQINELATRIAIDRDRGELTGEIDKNYINSLIKEQQDNHQETIQSSTLQKSLAFLKQEQADFLRRISD
ncbi:MAG: hypothetical protein NTY50_02395 [Methylobacter sp.]|nr:hypothetical protein [Methylobacter sp.]